jgi:hypothetical protein
MYNQATTSAYIMSVTTVTGHINQYIQTQDISISTSRHRTYQSVHPDTVHINQYIQTQDISISTSRHRTYQSVHPDTGHINQYIQTQGISISTQRCALKTSHTHSTVWHFSQVLFTCSLCDTWSTWLGYTVVYCYFTKQYTRSVKWKPGVRLQILSPSSGKKLMQQFPPKIQYSRSRGAIMWRLDVPINPNIRQNSPSPRKKPHRNKRSSQKNYVLRHNPLRRQWHVTNKAHSVSQWQI